MGLRQTSYALAALLIASTASAGPVTSGTWAGLPTLDLEVHKSEDSGCAPGPGRCAAVWYLPIGAEVLTGGFGYEGWTGATLVARQTEYIDGVLTYDGLSWTYSNAHGFSTSSWGGSHQTLYRNADAAGVQYWLAIEDLPDPFYLDHNDWVGTWRVDNPTLPPCTGACGPTEPPAIVPEPSVMALFGLAALAVRRRKQAKV